MKKTVVVGMSGGVDSSVSALILKKAGLNVVGVFMQNWDNLVNNEMNYNSDTCSITTDYNHALAVCQKLNIPLYKVDFISEYWNKVFATFIDDYKKGITPNPDILCNKYIKFEEFAKYCFANFKCDYVATGHYAKIFKKNNISYLSEAFDLEKDQTYFLCCLNQKQISNVIFPLMNLKKTDVRKIAKNYCLDNWNKKDSTGICFIGERKFKKFLENYIDNKKGLVIDIDTNKILGDHDGIYFYTIGQRRGLNLGGNSQKYFVCKKDFDKNIIYVASEENEEKYLMSNKCYLEEFNWISGIPKNNEVDVRFRHTQKKIKAFFEVINSDLVVLKYPEKSKSVTLGQYAVLYQKDICLGGGKVKEVFNQ